MRHRIAEGIQFLDCSFKLTGALDDTLLQLGIERDDLPLAPQKLSARAGQLLGSYLQSQGLAEQVDKDGYFRAQNVRVEWLVHVVDRAQPISPQDALSAAACGGHRTA